MSKKILSMVLAVVMLVGSAFTLTACGNDRLGEYNLPLLWRSCKEGDRHDATVGGFIMVLLEIY